MAVGTVKVLELVAIWHASDESWMTGVMIQSCSVLIRPYARVLFFMFVDLHGVSVAVASHLLKIRQ
jgi:hypothetical protein